MTNIFEQVLGKMEWLGCQAYFAKAVRSEHLEIFAKAGFVNNDNIDQETREYNDEEYDYWYELTNGKQDCILGIYNGMTFFEITDKD